MLNVPAALLALTLALTFASAVPALAQPNKPKPAADTQDDPAEEPAGSGKKVKTEGEKAEDGKAKPKPAAREDGDSRPGTPGPAAPTGSSPSRDR